MKILAYIISIAALLIVSVILLDYNRNEASFENIPKLLIQDDWMARRDAFGRLIGMEDYGASGALNVASILSETLEREPESTDERVLALIDLLETENVLVDESERYFISNDNQFPPGVEGLSEDYTNYLGDLIAAVTSVADMRAISALTGAIHTGGMVTRALVSLGPSAVRPVSALIDHPLHDRRSSAIFVLTQMLMGSEAVNNDRESISLIRDVIIRAASDENFSVRTNSVTGLALLGDRESIALLHRLAETDPFRADWPSKDGQYLVREAARAALAELEQ